MKKAIINGALLLVIGLVLWDGSPVWAQAFKHRLATRGRVWDVFWNTGNQGVWEQFLTTEYRAMSFSYPGQFVPDYRWDGPEYYGGQRSFAGLQPYQSSNMEMTALSAGLDMFIATVVGGDYFVTETKPAILSEDVFPIAYDPSKGPEANIGYPNISPGGAPMANWWPGQPLPGPEFPVEIHNYRYFQYMDPDKDMFAENTIISNYATKRGITVTKKAYSWSYPGYSDFIILDLTFENTGDSDGDGVADLNGGAGLQLDDTFFIFSERFYISLAGHTWHGSTALYGYAQTELVKDDWSKYTEAPNYDGPASGQGLKMYYGYDGDNPFVPWDDTGQPFKSDVSTYASISVGKIRFEGELTAYQYAGMAPIAYMPGAANDPSTWTYDTGGDASFVAPKVADQPYTYKWGEFRQKDDFDQPDARTLTYPAMYNALTGPASTIMDNSTEMGQIHGTFAYGPYDLAVGDKVRIVLVTAAAAPVEENFWGWALTAKVDEMHTDRTFNNLVKHVNAAKDAFKWGYDLPDPPPDVEVKVGVTPEANNRLTWDAGVADATDPDYSGAEARDVAGLRVYHSEIKVDNWKLLADLPPTATEYVDEKSVAGFVYVYTVRAYDTGHDDWNGTGMAIPSLEGGNSSPEQKAAGGRPFVPFVPANSAADQMQKQVVVVPNPYRDDGAHAYPAKERVRFLNLPHKCKVRIFTASGDLFGEFTHDDPSKGEANWAQVPIDFIGRASPSIYFFVVESQVQASLGQVQTGTFMIVK